MLLNLQDPGGHATLSDTGIGLAVFRRIVVRYCGRVWAEGDVWNGAPIYFEIPDKINIQELGVVGDEP